MLFCFCGVKISIQINLYHDNEIFLNNMKYQKKIVKKLTKVY